MRKSLCVGILKEANEEERRAPLVPEDVRWLTRHGIKVEVESSPKRIFKDVAYKRNGAKVLKKASRASLLVGIKPPVVENLSRGKVYMFFSHTRKGQKTNMPLLKECMRKKITLIDHEMVIDSFGMRLLHFGRFAGISGAVDSFHYLGKKLELQGIKNPFAQIRRAYEYGSLKEIKTAMKRCGGNIRRQGFDGKMTPFIVGITGHGNVSRGAQEVIDPLGPASIHPADILDFIKKRKYQGNKIYKVVFCREEGLRSKDGKGFYFEEYLKNPKNFRSDLDKHLPHITMLLHGSFWEKKYPRLITKKMVARLAGKKPFRLKFIGDISCDVSGSIELTYKTTASESAVFTYDPVKKKYMDGLDPKGISVLAVDNLPSELPREASSEFSRSLREYVYQIASCGAKNITRQVILPAEIRRGVITEGGKLTGKFDYLKQYIGGWLSD